MFVNYDFKYVHKGKHVFVPNEDCLRRGKKLLEFCSSTATFPPYFFHYRSGGHVEALHQHLKNKFFFRIDIENFFYSISRNRVAAALHGVGLAKARDYAKWSCVKNPLKGPAYALPIGFVQSPVLASLVILRSPLAEAIERANAAKVFVSVYFDDFIGSSMDKAALTAAYEAILSACDAANFVPNAGKLAGPAERLVAFNCDLQFNRVEVTESRITKFRDSEPALESIQAFEGYCARVARRNASA